MQVIYTVVVHYPPPHGSQVIYKYCTDYGANHVTLIRRSPLGLSVGAASLRIDCVFVVYFQVVLEAERRCRQELQAMRERHRARFVEATAKLRNQYKNLAKRARSLESQLTKNSVSSKHTC